MIMSTNTTISGESIISNEDIDPLEGIGSMFFPEPGYMLHFEDNPDGFFDFDSWKWVAPRGTDVIINSNFPYPKWEV